MYDPVPAYAPKVEVEMTSHRENAAFEPDQAVLITFVQANGISVLYFFNQADGFCMKRHHSFIIHFSERHFEKGFIVMIGHQRIPGEVDEFTYS